MPSRNRKGPDRPRPHAALEPARFVADAMLGSLARKLRAFGFDTSYFREGDDSDLVSAAAHEVRIILTSDRALSHLSASRGIRCLLIKGVNDSARLSSLASAAAAEGLALAPGPPRCSVCNGRLRVIGRPQAYGRVPLAVSVRHRLFYQCTSCGRVYWRGGHWKKLRWLQSRLVKKRDGAIPRGR